MVEVSVFLKSLFHTFSVFMNMRTHAQLLSYVQLDITIATHDYSPTGSSVHGIFQARILECAISYSRGYS